MQEDHLLSTKRIYSGKVLKLDLDTVALPNGRTTELEILRHPGASAVVPLKEDGRVVLIRQLRHAAGGFIYEIPAGKLDLQEDPKDCAARELEEEVGEETPSYLQEGLPENPTGAPLQKEEAALAGL